MRRESESDVKVDPVVKWIWSKVAITKSYDKFYHKCYHKVDLGANACMHAWVDLGEKGIRAEMGTRKHGEAFRDARPTAEI